MILAVGAHSRKVGKTSIICSVLQATPEAGWVAVKISSNRRGESAGLQIEEETEACSDRDTGRYLTAGAGRAFWIRARDHEMEQAARVVAQLSGQGQPLIVESNRVVDHLKPDLYVLALDFRLEDFKDSARRLFGKADAYLLSHYLTKTMPAAWPDLPYERLRRIPAYGIEPPDYRAFGLLENIRRRIEFSKSAVAA